VLGLEVRCGVHTGEIEMKGADIGGIAVHIAARIAALAEVIRCLYRALSCDLVAGSGLRFVDEGTRSLKGDTRRDSGVLRRGVAPPLLLSVGLNIAVRASPVLP
jgi:class 3 adenylate cyclase